MHRDTSFSILLHLMSRQGVFAEGKNNGITWLTKPYSIARDKNSIIIIIMCNISLALNRRTLSGIVYNFSPKNITYMILCLITHTDARPGGSVVSTPYHSRQLVDTDSHMTIGLILAQSQDH